MFKDFHTNLTSGCISYIKQISKEKELENKSARDCKRDDLKDHISGHDEGKGQSLKLEVGQHDAHGQVVESLIDLVMINSQEVGVDPKIHHQETLQPRCWGGHSRSGLQET